MNERPAPTTFQPATQGLTIPPLPLPLAGTTPAGLQDKAMLSRRRWLVLCLNLATLAALLSGLAHVLGAGGWSWADRAIFVAFLFGAPWTVLGFWNAVLGFWLLHGVKDGLERVAPFAAAGDLPTPINIRTAVLMTLRNEDPARAFARLHVVKQSLNATGEGG
ncbi:MAG: hypothetical protein Q8S58_00455, partial [Bosea sp. (in: a-proteobacteria)]|nr:hypothetical protein [Bosea sp. (in: a-proteobacteria)]